MNRHSTAWLLVTVGALVIAASCSGGEAPALPASSAPSPTAASLPYGGAPKVDRPLPSSVLSGDPCHNALTTGQLKEILGTTDPPKSENIAATGPSCRWDHPDSGAGLNVFYDIRTHQGLSSVYQNTKPKTTTWRPLPSVQGFPAVAFSIHPGPGIDNSCDVSVGIADDYTFDTALTLGRRKEGKADPCELTARVADMVAGNLRQRAGS
ncbi:DUF3558 domain-containing protein [Amycolatopsis sp. NPDC004079]|uniref:DUF3558 domain-containing protein n=1 Tax=Amycolatopsis sp. NPDC004079 TaxID=3154549 RepID=UPI0033A9D27D